MDVNPQKPYEPPKLIVLGSVERLTQTSSKQHGHTDGFMFGSHHITNAS